MADHDALLREAEKYLAGWGHWPHAKLIERLAAALLEETARADAEEVADAIRRAGADTAMWERNTWRDRATRLAALVRELRAENARLRDEDTATQNLFEMTRRFHDHCPAPVRPALAAPAPAPAPGDAGGRE